MKQLQNKKGFSLIFAMGIVLSISLTTIYLLEYIIPFSKDTKGIEFSTNAYYQSTSAVEESLYFVANNNLGDEGPGDPLLTGNTDFGYEIEALGDTIPPLGEGNSDYDSDWNILSPSKPLQVEIGENSWDGAEIRLRIPDTGIGNGMTLEPQTGGIITWQISSSSDTLIAESDSDRILSNELQSGSTHEINTIQKSGRTLTGDSLSFKGFYDTECDGANDKCTLKLSIINDLILNNAQKTPIPFIEYRITNLTAAPLRYTRINTEGYSRGFKKSIDIKVPQQTVNEAFDFTIFQ